MCLIPLSAPEVRRLWCGLVEPAWPFAFRVAWSHWRRRHQARAARCHWQRRLRQQAPALLPRAA